MEKRIEWVNWMRKRGIEISMTRTQTEFADHILADDKLMKMLEGIGDNLTIFNLIVYWAKNKEDKNGK